MRMVLDDQRSALLDQAMRQALTPRSRVADEFQIGVKDDDDQIGSLFRLGNPAQQAPLAERRHAWAVLRSPAGGELGSPEQE